MIKNKTRSDHGEGSVPLWYSSLRYYHIKYQWYAYSADPAVQSHWMVRSVRPSDPQKALHRLSWTSLLLVNKNPKMYPKRSILSEAKPSNPGEWRVNLVVSRDQSDSFQFCGNKMIPGLIHNYTIHKLVQKDIIYITWVKIQYDRFTAEIRLASWKYATILLQNMLNYG